MCDKCGTGLARKRGHGFVNDKGTQITCGKCEYPRKFKFRGKKK